MDCNREEAYRAKTLAEIKMRNYDFVGAQKLLMKAESLFSGLDSLPQMLAVCDVHISAESRIPQQVRKAHENICLAWSLISIFSQKCGVYWCLDFLMKSPLSKMTGKEREDVPHGCFELDTAALPKDMFEVEGGLDPFPEASKVELQEKFLKKMQQLEIYTNREGTQRKEEPPLIQTSAFSGKPVV